MGDGSAVIRTMVDSVTPGWHHACQVLHRRVERRPIELLRPYCHAYNSIPNRYS